MLENEVNRSGRPELAVRLIHGGGKILHLLTGMPLSDGVALVERCSINACRAAGLGGLPDERTPLAVRYQTVKDMTQLLHEELCLRGFSTEECDEVVEDLLSFYRGVRNVPSDW